MALEISAALSQAGTPRPVRVYVDGLTVGDAYRVTGSAGGHTWTVRGGEGDAADSPQLILTDIMTPLDRPITYQVISGDDVATAPSTVRVDYGRDVILQSLDGTEIIEIEVWRDNGDPIDIGLNSRLIHVDGRQHPITRWSRAGGESGLWEMVLTTPNTLKLREYLISGAQLVMRMARHMHDNGTQCDLPPVRVVTVTDAPRRMHGVPGKRVWSLAWSEVDDPLAGTVMVSDTWADVDAAYEGTTWADLDAAYEGATWADWNRFDWAGAAL